MGFEWKFIQSVLFFYGIIYLFYTLSNGQIAGLPSNNLIISVPASPTGNWLLDFLNGIGYWTTEIISFMFVLLIPFSSLAIFTPINWGLLGTTIYIYLRLIRGGG
jgi:hypothetical protein